MQKNDVNRLIPKQVGSYRQLKPFRFRPVTADRRKKVVGDLEEVIDRVGLRDGMTISFHHHFRDGDLLLNQVMDLIAARGIKDLTIVPTSLRNHHAKIIKHIKAGVIRKIYTTGLRGELGEEISRGIMDEPVIIYSHGGRAGAIETGEIKIDVAFIAAPSADELGNISGVQGDSSCGSLGYAIIDALYASQVVAVTDQLVSFPMGHVSIDQSYVDYVVEIDKIGDREKIATGSLRKVRNPKDLRMAEMVTEVISNLSNFQENFSIQTGSGGISLGVIPFLEKKMLERSIKGKFLLGGITGGHVQLLKTGLFQKIFDTQTFDLQAIKSLRDNDDHIEINASLYASPFHRAPLVNELDFVVLSALEVDTDFNVNVLTGFNGQFHGASGGHCDTAAGSRVSIVVAPSIRGRIPTIKKRVTNVITPGQTVDIVVTERGISVNPRREDLVAELGQVKGIELIPIQELQQRVEKITGQPKPLLFDDKVVALVQYRDGTIIDTVRKKRDK